MDSNLTEMIKAFNALQNDYHLKQSSLDEYVGKCMDGLKTDALKVHKGEMRFTAVKAGFNGLLGATHSSRVLLKLLNDYAQRELINVAEPLSAMSSLLGGVYEHTLLERAWLYLLKNHAHDSICGAAVNIAHLDNPGRFRATADISQECSRKACEQIWAKIDTAKEFKDGDMTLTFFNTLPVRRSGVEQVVVDVPPPGFGDMPVEQCTGVGPIVEGFNPDDLLTFQYFDVVDSKGNKVAYKLLERENIDMEVERKLDSSSAIYKLQRLRLLIEVNIPPMGYSTYALRPKKREYEPNPAPKGQKGLIATYGGVMENEWVKVVVSSNGTLTITDKASGVSRSGLHYFCDDASTGNAHQHKATLRNFTVSSLCNAARLSLMENNSLRATYRIDMSLEVPQEADLDNRNRSSNYRAIPVTTFVTVKKNSKRVEFKTVIDNQVKDHRLRILFPTDVQTDSAYADAPFDVVKRNAMWRDVKDNIECYHPYQPMQRFVSLTDGSTTFSFMSKGLGEYEVVNDEQRTLAITLIRTNRVMMLANHGKLTPEEYTQNLGQQCIGSYEFEYAVQVDNTPFEKAMIHNVADDFRVPIRAMQAVAKPGDLPSCYTMLDIAPSENIQVSAFYESKEADGYVLRLFNITDAPVTAAVTFNLPVRSVCKVKFDEQTLDQEVAVSNRKVAVEFKQKEIVTLLLKK